MADEDRDVGDGGDVVDGFRGFEAEELGERAKGIRADFKEKGKKKITPPPTTEARVTSGWSA